MNILKDCMLLEIEFYSVEKILSYWSGKSEMIKLDLLSEALKEES